MVNSLQLLCSKTFGILASVFSTTKAFIVIISAFALGAGDQASKFGEEVVLVEHPSDFTVTSDLVERAMSDFTAKRPPTVQQAPVPSKKPKAVRSIRHIQPEVSEKSYYPWKAIVVSPPSWTNFKNNLIFKPIKGVNCIPKISTNGKKVVSNGWVRRPSETLRIFDLDTLSEFDCPSASFRNGFKNKFLFVGFSPAGDRIITTSSGALNEVTLWDSETGELVRKFDSRGRAPYQADMSLDGQFLVVSFHYPSGITVYNIDSGEEVFSKQYINEEENRGGILISRFGPNSNILYTLAPLDEKRSRRTISVWDLNSNQMIRSERFPEMGERVALSFDRKKLVVFPAGKKNEFAKSKLIAFDQRNLDHANSFIEFTGLVGAAFGDWSPNGRWIVLGTEYGKAFFWDFKLGKALPINLNVAKEFTDIIWAHDGKRIIAMANHTAYILDVSMLVK